MNIKTNWHRTLRILALIVVFALSLTCLAGCGKSVKEDSKPIVGIAWREDTDSEFYTNVCSAVEAAGATPVLLEQVVSSKLEYSDGKVDKRFVDPNGYLTEAATALLKENRYNDSNVGDVINDIAAVIFTGGEDISPTLCANPADWHGIEAEKDYNATRDVSDYILMSYCLDNDIRILGLCRGMQMLAVISNFEIVQDIPTYYEDLGKDYGYEHRNEKELPDDYRDYVPHDVSVIDTDSILYRIVNSNTVVGCPSWHHQMVKLADVDNVRISGITPTGGIDVVEAIERTDKTYVLGLQFHPEAAIVKNQNNAENKSSFMSYDSAKAFFVDFIGIK